MDQVAAPTQLTDRDRTITMIGILTAMLLAALDQSIVTPAMPTIGGDLGDPQYLPWIVTSYLLTATAVAPLYGKVSDIYGRRGTLYAALGLFLVGSVISALSPNIFVLIGGRAVQGIGGGGLFALSQILIGDMLPPKERGRYAAWISGMWAVAGIAGPLLGGTLAEWHWSLIFWLNLPLGVVAMIVINNPLKKLHTAARAHKLDYPGAVLLVVATALLLLMLNWGGATYPWASPVIIGLAVVSVLLFVAFGFRLARAPEPLVSLEVLSNKIVLAGSFGMFMVAAANVGLAVYLPVYAQAWLGLSPAGSGYALLGAFPVTTVSVQSGVDQKHLGVAPGMLTFLRSLGSALGVAVLGAIALGYSIPLGAEAGGLKASRIADAFPFSVLFYTLAAMMLAGSAINALMPHKPLRGRAETPAPALAE